MSQCNVEARECGGEAAPIVPLTSERKVMRNAPAKASHTGSEGMASWRGEWRVVEKKERMKWQLQWERRTTPTHHGA